MPLHAPRIPGSDIIMENPAGELAFPFGMLPEKGRWILVVLGMIINMCLGTLYSWSVFVDPLTEYFSTDLGQAVSPNDVLMPFSVFIAVFSVTMLLTGRYVEKFRPRTVTIIGGFFTGLGWLLASTAPSILELTVLFGVIGGMGVGIAYGATIAVAARWFPDRRGLAVGMTVLGVGFSAVMTANLAGYLIGVYGIMTTFLIFGIGILAITVPMALPLTFPPQGWKPRGWNPPVAREVHYDVPEFSRREMIRTPAFYGLWICYCIGSIGGLMAVSIAKPVATDLVHIEAGLATSLVAFFALFNGGGRPLFGVLTDRINPRNTAMLSFVLIAAGGLLMWLAPTVSGYIVAFALLWGCLGGWLAIAPTVTAQYFGISDYPRCYGVVFLAYGAGAIAGPQLAGIFKTTTGNYLGVFPAVSALAILGLFVAFFLMKPPKKRARS